MATNKAISAFPTLLAANVTPADQLVIVDVSDTSSSSTGTTKNITLAAALNNPTNGEVTGLFVPSLHTAFLGGIVKTAQNGMVFQSSGGSLTDYAFLDASGLEILALRSSDEAVIAGKLIGLSAVPTVAVGPGAGTSATASVVGSNTAGVVTVHTGASGMTTGAIATLTFSLSYAGGAVANVQYGNAGGPLYPPIYTTTTMTTLEFGVTAAGNLSTAGTYLFNYQVIGYGN